MTGEILTLVSVGVSVAAFWVGRQTAAKTEGKEAGAVAKDIEYIKDSVDRVEKGLNDNVKRLEGRIDEQSQQLVTLAETVGKAYESAKMEHNRLNEHLAREHGKTIVESPIPRSGGDG